MRLQTTFRLLCLGVTLLLLGACGPSDQALTPTVDVTQVYIQAGQTVAAQFTQTSAAQTASAPTPTPTFTPTMIAPVTISPLATQPVFTLPAGGIPPLFTPTFSILPPQATPTGPLCNNSAWVADVGVKDGAVLKPGQAFARGWLVQNTGFCDWGIGYSLVRIGGNTDFGASLYVIRNVKDIIPAGTIGEISLNMVAPKTPGSYEAHYQMYSDKDVPFGTGLNIYIEVRK